MVNKVNALMEQLNAKCAFAPIDILKLLKKDAKDYNATDEASNFTRLVERAFYNFNLPETSFDINSVISVAISSPLVEVPIEYNGKNYIFNLPPEYMDRAALPSLIEKELSALLNSYGFHIHPAYGLPQKLLAARSGLGEYGRNNLMYVEGLGSYIVLTAFYTDIRIDTPFQDISRMKSCDHCSVCMDCCPTGAIQKDRKLIKAEVCMTYLNEFVDLVPFPDWLDSSAHNSMVGCVVCQKNCPKNKINQDNIVSPFHFNQDDIQILMMGLKESELPEDTRRKIQSLNLGEYLHLLPRNLHVLFEQTK